MILNHDAVLNPNLIIEGVAGVATFNGRLGEVVPQLGDYSAQMVGAIPIPPNDDQRRVLVGNSLSLEPEGVLTFNGRHGYVVPETGDYTPEMVNAIERPADDGQRRVLIGITPTLEPKLIVVDNLLSTSADDVLSANQGRILHATKQDNITGAASTVTSSNLVASRVAVSNALGKIDVSPVTTADLELIKDRTTRVKSELGWTNLNISITTAQTNLVSALKAITPDYGSWSPMFDTVANKMIAARNDDRTLHYKIAITGEFTNAASTNGLTLTVTTGAAVDVFDVVKIVGQAVQHVNFGSFISVDKNGNFATNGAILTLSATSNFNITAVRLIAEQ